MSAESNAPDRDRRRADLVAHLERHAGDAVRVLDPSGPGAAPELLVAGPAGSDHVTVVTCGAPGGTELAITLPAGWPGLDPLDHDRLADEAHGWPLRVLVALARLAGERGVRMVPGRTVPLSGPEGLAPGVRFAGALLVAPVEPQPVGDAQILSVVPLLPEELAFAGEVPVGPGSLTQRLAPLGPVVDVRRAPVVAGAPGYAAYVLLASLPADLGEVVRHATPNWAADLSARGALEAVFEDVNPVRLALDRPLPAAVVTRDVEPTSLSPAARAAAEQHRAVVTVLPETAGDHTLRLLSWVQLLCEREDALAVWLPHHGRVLTREEFTAAQSDEVLLQASVHPRQAPDGAPAVVTRGLAARGGREVWFSGDGLDHRALAKRLTTVLAHVEDADEIPRAGTRAKYGFTRYELADGIDPGTGDPVLVMAEAARPPREGLLRRRRRGD
ncbi:suppressor of fused domain protein [Nocardioides zeae]|uniref:Suppressor of fused domain protein n=1 Tax=Nocardioides imazamoxiresistens TaxID=3231893 RepID=A0ABU3PS58_9ACTN|nr:suppressor of fused domain protein [Nocardioides zeae]MDT9592033.1 suppressor of fused domain protein [Nocardioides zeae]